MKKLLLLLMAFAFVFASTTLVWAEHDAMTKLKDGAYKVVTFPKPLCDDVKDEYESSSFKPFGVFGGLLKGMGNSVIRLAGGLVDVLTFPVDLGN